MSGAARRGGARRDPGVAAALVALVERAAAHLPSLTVAALHRPPVDGARGKDGEFAALELSNGALGLAFVLLDGTLEALRGPETVDGLRGRPALEVARWFATATGARRTLGLAAINALSRAWFDARGERPPASPDSIGLLAPAPGDHVGMIGLFPPLAPAIVRSGARLTVVELRADLAGPRDGYEVTLDATRLADCNKVLATSALLLNDTLDRMLACCRAASMFALIGPTAGGLPDPLFARGVTLVGGTWIEDAARFKRALAEGAKWGAYASKFAIRREDWPGTGVGSGAG